MSQCYLKLDVPAEVYIDIAEAAYEAYTAVRRSTEGRYYGTWQHATGDRQNRAEEKVCFYFANPEKSAGECHERWVLDRQEEGYVLGDETDYEKKIHAWLKPLGDLPAHIIIAEEVFRTTAIVLIEQYKRRILVDYDDDYERKCRD